jgi:hypothetical protein
MTLNGAHGNENITLLGKTHICWVVNCPEEAVCKKYCPKTERNTRHFGWQYFCGHHAPLDSRPMEDGE